MNRTDTLTADATPRPIYRILMVILLSSIAGLILLAIVLATTYRGVASSSELTKQGKHRDCVTTLSAARRSVFDNVDIYKAISIQTFNKVSLDNFFGVAHTPDELEVIAAEFQTNDDQLQRALVEARRLQPAETLDRLIAQGGVIDGVRYEACPG